MFSVRMRSSFHGKHVSGAERICKREDIRNTVYELLTRPDNYDYISVKIERVEVKEIEKALPIKTYTFEKVEEAREFATGMLEREGIKTLILKKLFMALDTGASPDGGNMRGAMIVDIGSGERLEPDKRRGIRTVKVDWSSRKFITDLLLEKGYTLRTVDALAIATKNIHCGVVAEVCWSDDPDYTTGYIASKRLGYIRISPFKRKGSPYGGRIYFVNRGEKDRVITCLEKEAFLIKSL